ELLQIKTASDLLQAARSLSIRLTDQVAELVTAARRGSEEAARQAGQAISEGELLLLVITGVSLIGAILIVLLYVTPQVVRPLEHITAAMTKLAAGDTSVDIPARERGDEIGRMAQALGVFRDTAIEVQKSNLKEIDETRRRLSDAIESISEAFSLYDGDDRLVICNSKYRELYPDFADQIVTGTTFEEIIRKAIAKGYVMDSEGRVEDWLAERLAQHRQPKGSHLLHLSGGRWILVSERKTEDGGTVAVYSDISELKQREDELFDKSNALEQLSNQLAKYLSPQVYESIFTGKQEVKIASRRKKLTVFFSDIAGFTETTDRLESEDLTQLLNEYLTEMSRIALNFGATIDKYVGDAIVIFFGDPETRGVKEDALACIEMAVAMQKRLGQLHDVWRGSGIEKPLQCRIGINTGYCTVGNFGSEDRMDYTIIGNQVNLAARLESHAEVGGILMAHETHALVKDTVMAEEGDTLTTKGFAKPVRTYSVVGLYDDLAEQGRIIRRDQEGLALKIDRDKLTKKGKAEAIKAIKDVLSQLED
ncbi:MAG: PAS-domain containing protein, partial [Proteobacteria bacterium]|nr:PAS-domain containing protein [Pseudomonadota bacterium]